LSLLASIASMPGDLLAGPPPAAPPPAGKSKVLPGYVDQSDGKGGFVAPKAPPPPAPRASAAAPAAPLLPPAPHKFSYVPPVVPPDKKAGHCGIIDTGAGSQVAMDCLDADYDKIDGASQGLVDDDEIGAEPLPDRVNHLEDHTEGPVLNQGGALACTAFSLT